jgi:hypothetical protein
MTISSGLGRPRLTRTGDSSHPTALGQRAQQIDTMSPLGADLSRELGCPVQVSYVPKTREVVAVAHPDSGPEVRVTLPAPVALQLINNAFPALKNDLLKELRRQMDRGRLMDDEAPDIR